MADGPAAPPRARPPGGNPWSCLRRQRHRASDCRHRRDRGRAKSARSTRATHQVVSCPRCRHQSSDRSLRARPAARVPQARLRAGAVRRARRGGDRARHLVVAERPHRPHRGGRSGASAARGVPRLVPDAGSLGEPRVAVRRGHRRCDRQQQLGAARQPHAGGKPVLCGDPHQPFWVPSSWYEYALHGPEDDAAGAGHPGFPGMWWGSNGTIAWAITNNMASTRDLYVEQVDPQDPRRYRDGDTWREFDRTQCQHQGARRGGARADDPLHGARADGQRAGAVARCRRRSAAVAALGRHGAHGRHPRLHRDGARARLGRIPRRRCATGRWRSSTSSMPMPTAISAIRWRAAFRSAGASCRAFAMPTRRRINGRATFRSTTCRTCTTRRAATSPAPTSASCRMTGSNRSMAPIRRAIAACAWPRRLAAAAAMDTPANIGLQNDVKNCRAERLVPAHPAASGRR